MEKQIKASNIKWTNKIPKDCGILSAERIKCCFNYILLMHYPEKALF